MKDQPIRSRDYYPHFQSIQTRWMDNDVYGHINNVNYYSYFDTAVNQYLIEQGVLDFLNGEVIGLVVETHCNYMQSMAFPDVVDAGICVAKLGRSSVRYEIGLFKKDLLVPAAQGHFVHVYVDRVNRRPVAMPLDFKRALEYLEV